MFLIRTSCCEITHASGYYRAWPGWAVLVNGSLTTLVPVYKYHQASTGMEMLCPLFLLLLSNSFYFYFLSLYFCCLVLVLVAHSLCVSQFLQLSIVGCCWETVLCGSLAFLHILQAEALTTFVLDYLFMDVCTVSRLGR